MFACCGKGDRDRDAEAEQPARPAVRATVDSYEGELLDGERHGLGWGLLSDGSVYHGGWHRGRQHGEGHWLGADGSEYQGQWEQGEWSGEGVLYGPDMTRYQGQFAQGRIEGKGRMETLGGAGYEGEWSGGQRHGDGTATYAAGSTYIGQWVDGRRCGLGVHRTGHGAAYSGEWDWDGLTSATAVEVHELGRLVELTLRDSADSKVKVSGRMLPDTVVCEQHRELFQDRLAGPGCCFGTSVYDGTARRTDEQLATALSQLPKNCQEDGMLIGQHLTAVLQRPIHPFGLMVSQFVLQFKERYALPTFDQAAVGCKVAAARQELLQLQLNSAVANLREFLIGFKEHICAVLSGCLNSKARRLHAHAVLLDVVFPEVYMPLWELYCQVTAQQQAELDARIPHLATVSSRQLGIRPEGRN